MWEWLRGSSLSEQAVVTRFVCQQSEVSPLSSAIAEGSSGEPEEILTPVSDLVQASSERPNPDSERTVTSPQGAASNSRRAAPVPSRSGPIEASECDWQTAMKRAIRSEADLRRAVGLPPAEEVGAGFATFVPLEYVRRIEPGEPADPLLLQVLPRPEERSSVAGFTSDPVGDLHSLTAGGLIHKYEGRALLISSGVCAVHCRYCFRREFPYQDAGSRVDSWQPALDYLRDHEELDEVILSGGDPLTLVDQTLFRLISAVEAIPHVARLRIHSRMPIVIPQRLTAELTARLASSRLAVWLVVHANHPRELDTQVLEHLARVRSAGIPLLNQAVLLRGVNDCHQTLAALCRKLVNHGVQPYYLHQLDRVNGSAHFEVSVTEGLNLMRHLEHSLPGYAVPKYVGEHAGEPSKTSLTQR